MNILQMLVQSNHVDSPIQDCAHVSLVWSVILLRLQSQRLNLSNSNTVVFYILCTKRLSQGFGEMLLSFITKQIYLV